MVVGLLVLIILPHGFSFFFLLCYLCIVPQHRITGKFPKIPPRRPVSAASPSRRIPPSAARFPPVCSDACFIKFFAAKSLCSFVFSCKSPCFVIGFTRTMRRVAFSRGFLARRNPPLICFMHLSGCIERCAHKRSSPGIPPVIPVTQTSKSKRPRF